MLAADSNDEKPVPHVWRWKLLTTSLISWHIATLCD
jgi:hypothetical protein